MNIRDKKRAFTLAEVLIVLLVLSIIFAVFAPIISKKRTPLSKYAVWNATDKTSELSAFYGTNDYQKPAQAFIGITPSNNATSDFLPYSKLIIRSVPINSKIQKQIHFRYGYPEDKVDENIYRSLGYDVGSWLMDGKNILIGGKYSNLDSNFATNDDVAAINNIALGSDALNAINNKSTGNNKTENNIAIGYNAALNLSNRANSNIYIGSNAGAHSNVTDTNYNTVVGSHAGYLSHGSQITILGYKAGYYPHNDLNNTPNGSVFVGAYAGHGYNDEKNTNRGRSNIAIGYNSLSSLKQNSIGVNTGNKYNVAIGYNALGSLEKGENNVAIGYNACSQLVESSNKICIGANSGPKSDIKSAYGKNSRKQRGDDKSYAEAYLNATGANGKADDTERIYIGGTPHYYGGDAVLEVHNVGTRNRYLINSPSIQSNVTTIINGNLIVRGRTYFTSGDSLYNFYQQPSYKEEGVSILGGNKVNSACADGDPFTYRFHNTKFPCPSLIQPNTTSDRRLKYIGSKNNSGLEKILQLKVKDYIFKDDNTKTPQTGVIAQQLQKIFPNSVFSDEEGYLSIKLDEMFYAAINALKELDSKIVSLVKRTVKVESTISKLEKENILLKDQVTNLTTRIEKIKASRGL